MKVWVFPFFGYHEQCYQTPISKFCVGMFPILLSISLEFELLGLKVTLCSTFWGTGRLFSNKATPWCLLLTFLKNHYLRENWGVQGGEGVMGSIEEVLVFCSPEEPFPTSPRSPLASCRVLLSVSRDHWGSITRCNRWRPGQKHLVIGTIGKLSVLSVLFQLRVCWFITRD